MLIAKNNSFKKSTSLTLANLHSLMNHSCAANVVSYEAGNQRFTISIRPIKMGQPLHICYLDSVDKKSWKQRRTELKSKWNFICKCEQCIYQETKDREPEPEYPNPNMGDAMMRRCTQEDLQHGEYENAMKNCEKHLNLVANARPWSMEIQDVANLLANIYRVKYSY